MGSYNPTPGDISGENSEFKICMHPIFIAALFTIAKKWKQPKCPLTDEWTKMWCTHTHTHPHTHTGMSAIENEKNAICSNMDGPGEYHSK